MEAELSAQQYAETLEVLDKMGFAPGLFFELMERIRKVGEDGGFGSVTVVIKNARVYKISHTVDGKPIVDKGDDDDQRN